MTTSAAVFAAAPQPLVPQDVAPSIAWQCGIWAALVECGLTAHDPSPPVTPKAESMRSPAGQQRKSAEIARHKAETQEDDAAPVRFIAVTPAQLPAHRMVLPQLPARAAATEPATAVSPRSGEVCALASHPEATDRSQLAFHGVLTLRNIIEPVPEFAPAAGFPDETACAPPLPEQISVPTRPTLHPEAAESAARNLPAALPGERRQEAAPSPSEENRRLSSADVTLLPNPATHQGPAHEDNHHQEAATPAPRGETPRTAGDREPATEEPAPLRDFSVRVRLSPQQDVSLHFIEREGGVRLFVRTPDPSLSGALQSQLPQLESALRTGGFEASLSAGPEASAHSSASFGADAGRHEPGSGGSARHAPESEQAGASSDAGGAESRGGRTARHLDEVDELAELSALKRLVRERSKR